MSLNATGTVTTASTVLALDSVTSSTLLGAIIAIASTAFGALLTNILRTRWERKRRMQEIVFEPLLGQLMRVLQSIGAGEKPDLNELEKISMHPAAFLLSKDLKKKISSAKGLFRLYGIFYRSALAKIQTIITQEIDRYVSEHGVSPEVKKSLGLGKYQLEYRAFVGTQLLGSVTSEICLLLSMQPFDILMDRLGGMRNVKIQYILGGHVFDKEASEAILRSAMNLADKDEDIEVARSMRHTIAVSENSPVRPLFELLKQQF